MSVLAQVLDELAARGADAPRPLVSAAMPAAPVATPLPLAPARKSSPRQGIWLAVLTILAVTTAAMAWIEHRLASRPLVRQPLGLQELDRMGALQAGSSVVRTAPPEDKPAQPSPAGAPLAEAQSAARPPANAPARAVALAPAAPPAAAAPTDGPQARPAPAPRRAVEASSAAPTTAATPPADLPAVRRVPAGEPASELARAIELIERGRGSEAKPVLHEVLARDPRNAPARHALAALEAESGDRMQALATLLAGAAVDPQRFAMPAAQLQTELGDASGALNTLQRMPPERRDGAFYALAGGIALAADAPQQAVQAYQRAVSMPNAQPLWLVGLALAQETAGQAAEAQTTYTRALQQPRLPPDARMFVQQKLGTPSPSITVRPSAVTATAGTQR